ncbi:unnamed protein product [Urochloa humidicola]
MASTPSTSVDPVATGIRSLSERMDRLMRRMEETLARMDGTPAPVAPAVSTATSTSASSSSTSARVSTTTAPAPSPTTAAAAKADVVITNAPPPPTSPTSSIGAPDASPTSATTLPTPMSTNLFPGAQKVFDELATSSYVVVSSEDDYRDSLGVRYHRICKVPAKRLRYLNTLKRCASLMSPTPTPSASTSIDTTMITPITTSNHPQVPPARCSTPGPTHGDGSTHVLRIAVSAPSSTSLQSPPSFLAAAPTLSLPATSTPPGLATGEVAQCRYITSPIIPLSGGVILLAMAANAQGDHTSQHLVLLETQLAISVDTGQGQSTMAVEKVAIPPKPPWSLISTEDGSFTIDSSSQSAWILCSYLLKDNITLLTDDAQLRTIPWPSFTSDTVWDITCLIGYSTATCVFDRGKSGDRINLQDGTMHRTKLISDGIQHTHTKMVCGTVNQSMVKTLMGDISRECLQLGLELYEMTVQIGGIQWKDIRLFRMGRYVFLLAWCDDATVQRELNGIVLILKYWPTGWKCHSTGKAKVATFSNGKFIDELLTSIKVSHHTVLCDSACDQCFLDALGSLDCLGDLTVRQIGLYLVNKSRGACHQFEREPDPLLHISEIAKFSGGNYLPIFKMDSSKTLLMLFLSSTSWCLGLSWKPTWQSPVYQFCRWNFTDLILNKYNSTVDIFLWPLIVQKHVGYVSAVELSLEHMSTICTLQKTRYWTTTTSLIGLLMIKPESKEVITTKQLLISWDPGGNQGSLTGSTTVGDINLHTNSVKVVHIKWCLSLLLYGSVHKQHYVPCFDSLLIADNLQLQQNQAFTHTWAYILTELSSVHLSHQTSQNSKQWKHQFYGLVIEDP